MTSWCPLSHPYYCNPTKPRHINRNLANGKGKTKSNQCVDDPINCEYSTTQKNYTRSNCISKNSGKTEQCTNEDPVSLSIVPNKDIMVQLIEEHEEKKAAPVREQAMARENRALRRNPPMGKERAPERAADPSASILKSLPPSVSAKFADKTPEEVSEGLMVILEEDDSKDTAESMYAWLKGERIPGVRAVVYDAPYAVLLDEIARISFSIQSGKKQPIRASSSLTEIQSYVAEHFPINPFKRLAAKSVLTKKRVGKESVYGRVYQNIISGIPMAFKAPVYFSQTYVIEMYVNMVLLNGILQDPAFESTRPHLVAPYGMFVARSNIPEAGLVDRFGDPAVLDNATQLVIAKGKKLNSTPSLCLLQQFVRGKTLSDMIEDGEMTWPLLQTYMTQVFDVLVLLERHPVNLSHNDLHTGNIMIQDGKAVIIDWGMACFRHPSGTIYRHTLFENYDPRGNFYHTAALDVLQLVRVAMREAQNRLMSHPTAEYQQIVDELQRMLNAIETHFGFILDQEINPFMLFIAMSKEEKKQWNHASTVKKLEAFTYQVACDMLGLRVAAPAAGSRQPLIDELNSKWEITGVNPEKNELTLCDKISGVCMIVVASALLYGKITGLLGKKSKRGKKNKRGKKRSSKKRN